MITAVVFDVGETLIDDTAEWAAWADWLGVPRHTFSAVLGAVVASGRNNAETFQYFRPGFDLPAERQRREEAGRGQRITEEDLYSDVRESLRKLRADGLLVGIAGNQPAMIGGQLRRLQLPADFIATSEEWGVAKPDREFFHEISRRTGKPAQEILYVGDHPAQDIIPAKQLGMRAVLIRRGPWGHLWSDDASTRASADAIAEDLTMVRDIVRQLNEST